MKNIKSKLSKSRAPFVFAAAKKNGSTIGGLAEKGIYRLCSGSDVIDLESISAELGITPGQSSDFYVLHTSVSDFAFKYAKDLHAHLLRSGVIGGGKRKKRASKRIGSSMIILYLIIIGAKYVLGEAASDLFQDKSLEKDDARNETEDINQ